MKSLHTLFALALVAFTFSANAQLSVTLVPSNHYGSNISCHGGNDGTLNAVATGGTEPYTYQWSNSATEPSLDGLTAGMYTVTVTDADNNSVAESIEILEPNILTVQTAGKNITIYGLSNGSATALVGGGTPPYQFNWSNNSGNPSIEGLPPGSYSVSVSDMNGCTANSQITLTQPDQLVISGITSAQHNGFNISCAKGNDGTASVQVSGGVTPYLYYWSDGSKEQTLTNAKAGTYQITVVDANGAKANGQTELTEPTPLQLRLVPSFFPNGYNVSCNECANGSITAEVAGGIPSYSYHWNNLRLPATFQNAASAAAIASPQPVGAIPPAGFPQIPWDGTSSLSSLMAGEYNLIMADANGCLIGTRAQLAQPDKNAWSQNGDANTDPENQFIGTTDEKDLVFKTNLVERLRIKSDGAINLSSFQGDGERNIMVDASGNIYPSTRQACFPWCTNGNIVDPGQFIGSYNDEDLVFKTGSAVQERARLFNAKDMWMQIGPDPNNALQIVRSVPDDNGDIIKPQRRGISLGLDDGTATNNDGSFNFFVHTWLNGNTPEKEAAFNFIDGLNSGNPFLMTIKGNGNVGIGTNSPQSKLEIAGGDLTVKTLNGAGNRVVMADPTGKLIATTANSSAAWLTNGNAGLPAASFLGTTDQSPLQINVNSTPIIKVTNTGPNTGKVQIGDPSETAQLWVNNSFLIGLNAQTGGNSIGTIGDLTIGGMGNINISAPPFFTFHPKINITADNIIMNGSVGIGTPMPNDKLEVKDGFGRFSSTNGYLSIGHDGFNGVIYNNGAGKLLLNWNNHNEVDIGTSGTPGWASEVHLGGTIFVEGADFKLGQQDGRNQGPSKFHNRALVHADADHQTGPVNDELIINYDGDFEGGVRVAGPNLKVDALAGTGNYNCLVLSDPDGQLNKLVIPNDPTRVLFANGQWGYLPQNSNGWHYAGGDITSINTGNVGIGTSYPSTAITSYTNPKVLHIAGTVPMIRLEDNIMEPGTDALTNFEIVATNGDARLISSGGLSIMLDSDLPDISAPANDIFFSVAKREHSFSSGYSNNELFKVNSSGVASARAMKVTLAAFPDYVFKNDYSLMPISEVEKFIADNHHLPNIPTAEEVEKDGLDLGDMQSRLTQKIEELTLYLIDIKKQNEELKSRIVKLENIK
jgi:hypothetical protein